MAETDQVIKLEYDSDKEESNTIDTPPITSTIPSDNVQVDLHLTHNDAKQEAEQDINPRSDKQEQTQAVEVISKQRADLYDADGDGICDDEVFEGSTHSFAIYYETKQNVSGVIIAYFVLAMQTILYLVCAAQVMGDLSGSEFVIPVMVRYGKKCSDPSNLGILSTTLLSQMRSNPFSDLKLQ